MASLNTRKKASEVATERECRCVGYEEVQGSPGQMTQRTTDDGKVQPSPMGCALDGDIFQCHCEMTKVRHG